MSRSPRHLTRCTLLVVAVALAACGGDDGSGASVDTVQVARNAMLPSSSTVDSGSPLDFVAAGNAICVAMQQRAEGLPLRPLPEQSPNGWDEYNARAWRDYLSTRRDLYGEAAVEFAALTAPDDLAPTLDRLVADTKALSSLLGKMDSAFAAAFPDADFVSVDLADEVLGDFRSGFETLAAAIAGSMADLALGDCTATS